MSEPIDPAAIMAEHHPPRLDPDGEQDCMGADYDCPYMWPCPTYRLAEALVAARAEIERLKQQNPWQVEWDTTDYLANVDDDDPPPDMSAPATLTISARDLGPADE